MSDDSNEDAVDAYIAGFDGPAGDALNAIRTMIRSLLPEAQHVISYAIPTIKVDGQSVVHFAGWAKHISVYPVPRSDAALLTELDPYVSGKGTLAFPLNNPIPLDLIRRTVQTLAEERRSN